MVMAVSNDDGVVLRGMLNVLHIFGGADEEHDYNDLHLFHMGISSQPIQCIINAKNHAYL